MQSKGNPKSQAAPQELPPLLGMQGSIKRPIKVKLTQRAKDYLLKGDAHELRLTDNDTENTLLAGLGQRYVMIAYYINGIWHVSALPSYDFQEATEIFNHSELTEQRLNAMIDRAIAYFRSQGIDCKREHVVMPDHSFFTGVVHRQAKRVFESEEKPLLDSAQGQPIIASFSCRKQFEKFTFTDRAADNSRYTSRSQLALACNLYPPFEIGDIATMKPQKKTSLRYSLGRSLERSFFEEFASAIVRDLYPEDPLKRHLKFNTDTYKYRAGWERMRKLYKKDKAAACFEIQHALVRNLYLYLFVGAQEMNKEDWEGLCKGIQEAEAMGIPIDYNYIPPDIARHPLANSMRKIVKEFGAQIKANDYGWVFPRPLIFYFVERGDMDEVKHLLENKVAADQTIDGISLLDFAVKNRHFNVAALLCRHGARIETLNEYNRPIVQSVLDAKAEDIINMIHQKQPDLAKQAISIQSPPEQKKIFEKICDEFQDDKVGEYRDYSNSEYQLYLKHLTSIYTLPSILQTFLQRNYINAIDFLLKDTSSFYFQTVLDEMSPLDRMNFAEGYIKHSLGELHNKLPPFEHAQHYLLQIAKIPFNNGQEYENRMRLLLIPFREENTSHSLAIYNERGESPLYKLMKNDKRCIAQLVRVGLIDFNFKIKQDQNVIQAFLQDNYINGIVYLIETMTPEQLVRAFDNLDSYDRVRLAVIYITHSNRSPKEVTHILANSDLNVLNAQGHTLLYEAYKNCLNLTNYTYWHKVFEYLKTPPETQQPARADFNAGTEGHFPLDLAIDSNSLETICRLTQAGAVRFSKDKTFKLFSVLWNQYQKGTTFLYYENFLKSEQIEVYSALEKLLKPLNKKGLEEVKEDLRQAFIDYLLGINDQDSRVNHINIMLNPANPFGKLLLSREPGLTLFSKNPEVIKFNHQLTGMVGAAGNTPIMKGNMGESLE